MRFSLGLRASRWPSSICAPGDDGAVAAAELQAPAARSRRATPRGPAARALDLRGDARAGARSLSRRSPARMRSRLRCACALGGGVLALHAVAQLGELALGGLPGQRLAQRSPPCRRASARLSISSSCWRRFQTSSISPRVRTRSDLSSSSSASPSSSVARPATRLVEHRLLAQRRRAPASRAARRAGSGRSRRWRQRIVRRGGRCSS